LSIDSHRLFYILMRLEALGINIGTLDVKIDSPSRPMSYINLFADADTSETLSMASFRSSFSAVSGLSLGAGWWGRPEPPTVEAELKYIYSSFTKLPALSVNAPGRKTIAELANEPPNENALPLDAFKNLQTLECADIDPRALLGWDRLAESLRSLTIRKSGLEDVSDIFIGAVVDDQARRDGSTSRSRQRRIPHGPSKQPSFYSTPLPTSVPEDAEEGGPADDASPSPVSSAQLSSLKWAFLKHLSLSDNALTFFPLDPLIYLTSLTHLDLSSNLLVSVPPGLSTLYNLVSLNLADNMIDSVLGIYLNLGQVLSLNLSRNRLESICGLERLLALERVDLRQNVIEDSAEVGRLATLPNISDVWVEGNPFVELEDNYRISCFDYFWKEGKSITLDGTAPGFYEKRNLTVAPPEQMSSSRPLSTAASSPPVVAVSSHPPPSNAVDIQTTKKFAPPSSSPPSQNPSPLLAAAVAGKTRRKKIKRIVELDEGDNSDTSTSHIRTRSDGSYRSRTTAKNESSPAKQVTRLPDPVISFAAKAMLPVLKPEQPSPQPSSSSHPPVRSRHTRHHTEFLYTPDPIPESATNSVRKATRSGSATFSSKSMARRARVSASVYEPPTSTAIAGGAVGGAENQIRDADAYRKRIEALRADMGDRWLKVFSQSQMGSTGVASG
jgi:Leucine-rich repeat (LRR) protein